MKLDTIKNERTAASGLLAIAIVAVLGLGLKAAAYVQGGPESRRAVEAAMEQTLRMGGEEAVEQYRAAATKTVDRLVASNAFSPRAERSSPPQVTGILGSEALINGSWYSAGHEINGARILRVEPTYAVIEWEGEEVYLAPIASDTRTGDATGERRARRRPGDDRRPAFDRNAIADRIARITPEERTAIAERIRNITPEEAEQMRERFRNMTPEERRAMWEARGGFGGREGGRGRGDGDR